MMKLVAESRRWFFAAHGIGNDMKQRLNYTFLCALLLSWLIGSAAWAADEPASVRIENDVLRISLDRSDATGTAASG